MLPELVTVTSDEAVILRDGHLVTYENLRPGSTIDLDGIEVTTLPRPGTRLSTVATTNDVHFGETECGRLGDAAIDPGPILSVPPGAEPYPAMMSRLAVDEIATFQPDMVVVKGDLTNEGKPDEYADFLACYQPVFAERLFHVRGNHDCYQGQDYASASFQEIEVPGAVVAIVDTCRPGLTNGSITGEQLERLDELGARADRPVIVLGHHPVWDQRWQPRDDDVFGLLPEPTEQLFEIFARRARLVTYSAGHTHRNHVLEVAGVPYTEVASLKDFPGAWCEYQIFDDGILQVTRRVSHPEAMAWSEQTRVMFAGAYEHYALGSVKDRCRLIRTDRS